LSEHPSKQLLERYSQRRLEAEELLALDDHFSACVACLERWRQMKPGTDALLTLRSSLEVAAEAPTDHLLHKQLLAYAEDRLDEADRELAESHLEACPRCVAQAQELHDRVAREARAVDTLSTPADISSLPPALWTRLTAAVSLSSLRGRFLSLPTRLRMAAAVAALALLVIAVALWLRPQKNGHEIVDRRPTTSPPPSQPPLRPSPEPKPENPAPILLALNDGSGQITLDAQGNFSGLESISPADQQRIKAALETRKVQTPEILEEIRDLSAPVMGPSGGIAFALLSPVGEVVASDRPTFRWRPVSGAISYQITITDPASGYKEVGASPQLQGTKWTADRPLERGRVYTWQITARTDGGKLNATEAGAREAKFKVLEQATIDELARAKKAYPGRRLALGLLYAEVGLLDEAEREMKALVAANPQSPIVKSLLRDVQSKQRRRG